MVIDKLEPQGQAQPVAFDSMKLLITPGRLKKITGLFEDADQMIGLEQFFEAAYKIIGECMSRADAQTGSVTVAQPVADERAAFEQWVLSIGGKPKFKGSAYAPEKPCDWYYFEDHINDSWSGWKARAADSEKDKKDAARWREMLMHVGAESYPHRGHVFELRGIVPLLGSNVMKGSVAQHFTDSIDAAIARAALCQPAEEGDKA